MKKIVVVGSINMDLIMETPRLPALGETLLGGPFSTAPGGKGANQSAACARLGAEAVHIGRLGDDLFGRQLLEVLKDEGIDTSAIAVTAGTNSGVAQICVAGGDNSIIVAPGANALLSARDVRDHRGLFREARAALFQLEVPLEAVTEGLRLARAEGALTILNPAPWRPLPDETLALVDVFVPNAIELSQCAMTANREKAFEKLLETGVGAVVMTAGSDGAYFASSHRSGHVPAPSVDVVDSTGAGDTFTGALAVSLAEGHQLQEAVHFGVHAGALACTRLGALPAIPRRDEVEAFLARS